MSVWSVIGHRIGLALVTLFFTSVAMFAIMHAVPGNPVDAILSDRQASSPETRERFEQLYGLDKPLPAQYLYYLRNLLRGDLGTSISTNQPVAEELSRVVPATLELAIVAMLITIVVGVPLGVIAAVRRNAWPDHLARLLAVLSASVPIFWMSLLLAWVFAYRLQWLPRSGQLDPGMDYPPRVTGMITVDAVLAGQPDQFISATRHMVLPATVLALFALGIVTRMIRASLLDALGQEYVRTARAKGLAERQIVANHALRNALLPAVTILGLTFSGLLTGAAIVETIFSWPGIGQYAVRTALTFNYPAMIGVTLVIAVIYIIVSLCTDIAYALIDPRIRFSG